MSQPDEVSRARKKLFDSLGDNTNKYLMLLRLWFQMKLDREEFERTSREFLTSEQVHLHNTFIVALISKCHRLSVHQSAIIYENPDHSHGGTGPPDSPAVRVCSGPVHELDAMPTLQQLNSHHAAHGRALSDELSVYNQAMIGALEHGLKGVDDDAVKLLRTSMMALLRKVLFTTICRRRYSHSVDDHSSYGVDKHYVTKLMRRKQNNRKLDSAMSNVKEKSAPKQEKSEGNNKIEYSISSDKQPITLHELLDSVRVHWSLAQSSKVMSLLEERILNRLSEKSHEEQQDKHRSDDALSPNDHSSVIKCNDKF